MSARTQLKRLQRLAEDVGPLGCPACRSRQGRTVLLTVEVRPDGTERCEEAPAPCPACGEVPERIIAITEQVVTAAEC